MTHISNVLETVAPEPTRHFDADAFVRRALVRRRQRFLRWLGAVVVGGVAVGVPTQLALSPAGESGLDVDTVAPTTTTTLVVDVDGALPADGPVGSSQGGGSRSGSQRPAAAPGSSPKGKAPSPGDPYGGGDEAATTEGCSVYSQPSAQGGGPVEDPGENETVSTCEYSATTTAGYSGSGTWTLEIVRDGETITYDSVTSPACAAVGVVQPGDYVRARLGLPGSQSTPVRASAGDGQWHLDVSPSITC